MNVDIPTLPLTLTPPPLHAPHSLVPRKYQHTHGVLLVLTPKNWIYVYLDMYLLHQHLAILHYYYALITMYKCDNCDVTIAIHTMCIYVVCTDVHNDAIYKCVDTQKDIVIHTDTYISK